MKTEYRIREGVDGYGNTFYKVQRKDWFLPFVWYAAFVESLSGQAYHYASLDDAKNDLIELIKDESEKHERAKRQKIKYKKTVMKIRGLFSRCDVCDNGLEKNACGTLGRKLKND